MGSGPAGSQTGLGLTFCLKVEKIINKPPPENPAILTPVPPSLTGILLFSTKLAVHLATPGTQSQQSNCIAQQDFSHPSSKLNI